MTENYLTIKQVAAKLQLTDKTLKKLRDNGTLPAHRLGRIVRYSESEVNAILTKKEKVNG